MVSVALAEGRLPADQCSQAQQGIRGGGMHQGMTDAQCTGDLTLGVGALISLNKPIAQTQNALGTWGEVGEQGLHLLVGVRVTHRRSRLRGSFFGPNLGYRNQRRANTQVVNLILVGILLFMLVIQLPLTAYALGAQVDVTLVICLTVSILIMFLGNYLGKLRRNFWVGIRTPWTLASDIVWERTHRLGGWLFVPVGFISLITSFFPPLRYIGLFVPLIVVVIVLVVYSYIAYQLYTVGGREPLVIIPISLQSSGLINLQ
jgi:uncharacterized membrane protein